ncbi:ANTAR domain-containing protein [Streptomyces luteogriseus]|uniref:ANTAR domain-containing protein n=1 Tax=Streptomyces luteogriseus TaxID=68233 RepID=UPI0037AB712A
MRADGRPFGCYHRVTDTSSEEHAVVLVADDRTDDDGSVVTLRGFVIDVTESLVSRVRDFTESDVTRARVSRQDIGLARGILMARYGVDADADVALRLLSRWSQDTNRKVRDLARELLAAAPTPAGGERQDLSRRDLSRRVGSVLYARETD